MLSIRSIVNSSLLLCILCTLGGDDQDSPPSFPITGSNEDLPLAGIRGSEEVAGDTSGYEWSERTLHCLFANDLSDINWRIIGTEQQFVEDALYWVEESDVDGALYINDSQTRYQPPRTPLLYYGDELALAGGNDPDSRKDMPWTGESHNGQSKLSVIAMSKRATAHRLDIPIPEFLWTALNVPRSLGQSPHLGEGQLSLNEDHTQFIPNMPAGAASVWI